MDVDANWTEKLISLIESKPLLYNKGLKEYSNRDLKEKAWNEVYGNLLPDWGDLSEETRRLKGYNNNAPPAGYPPQAGYQPPQAGYPPPQPGYPPPQLGYPPSHQADTQTVVVSQPPVFIVQPISNVPTRMTCPHCRAQIETGVHHEIGTYTWLMCLLLCLVGFDLGCCLIPFCVDGCQDTIHTCPNCHQTISRVNRM